MNVPFLANASRYAFASPLRQPQNGKPHHPHAFSVDARFGHAQPDPMATAVDMVTTALAQRGNQPEMLGFQATGETFVFEDFSGVAKPTGQPGKKLYTISRNGQRQPIAQVEADEAQSPFKPIFEAAYGFYQLPGVNSTRDLFRMLLDGTKRKYFKWEHLNTADRQNFSAKVGETQITIDSEGRLTLSKDHASLTILGEDKKIAEELRNLIRIQVQIAHLRQQIAELEVQRADAIGTVEALI